MRKLCGCGCGQEVGTYAANDKRWGYIKGEPRNFLPGHSSKGRNHWNWKNGTTTRYDGRILLHTGGVSRKYESRQVVEDIIGKPLPQQAVVHHIDNNPSNNDPSNLIVCNDHSHHRLIHARQTAYKICDHASWRKCRHCHQYDDPENMKTYAFNGKSTWYHQKCNTEHFRRYRAERRNRAEAESRLWENKGR